jgi:hypothetical protein
MHMRRTDILMGPPYLLGEHGESVAGGLLVETQFRWLCQKIVHADDLPRRDVAYQRIVSWVSALKLGEAVGGSSKAQVLPFIRSAVRVAAIRSGLTHL